MQPPPGVVASDSVPTRDLGQDAARAALDASSPVLPAENGDGDELREFFPDAFAEADLDTRTLTLVNSQFTILTGYTREDVAAGLLAWDLFDHQSRVRITAKIQRELAIDPDSAYERTGRQEFVPVRVLRKDGSWFAGEVHGSYILAGRERPRGIRFVLRDMDDYTSLTRQLDLSRARWEALSEISPVGIFHTDRDGQFTELNRRLSVLTRMPPEDLLGYGYMQAIHPGDEPAVRLSIQEALRAADSEQSFRFECRLRYPEGSERWVQVECVGIRDPAGEPGGFLGTVTEITEQKRANSRVAADLEASERLLELILASTPAAIAVADQEGRFVRVNAAACEVTGYSAPELLAMNVADLAPGQGRLIPRMLSGEALRGAITEIKIRGGRRRRGNLAFAPVTAADGARLTVVTFLDQTERLETEALLAEAQKLESVGLLAGGIAHDFNNVLTVISGSAALARSAIEDGEPALEDIGRIEDGVSRAAALVSQLLTFARRQDADPQVVDLNEAIQRAWQILEQLVGTGVEFEARLEPEPCLVWIDPTQFDQVLLNLATNARDAMASGSGRFTISTSKVRGRAGLIRLTVSDTGSGMDDETRRRVFEPFFTTKPHGRGTGLGLATTHGIVKRASGEIEIESEVGHGTTFVITFPDAGGQPA